MNSKIYSIITAALTIIGSFLIGKTLFGQAVDEVLWQTITGAVMTLAGIVMSVLDKSLTIEKLQASIRTVVIAVGGVLIGAGKLTPEKLETWAGVIAALLPMIYTWLSKKKSEQIVSGDISKSQLKTD